MLVANSGAHGQTLYESERMNSDIGTIRIIAEVFRELFFMAVRSNQTSFNR